MSEQIPSEKMFGCPFCGGIPTKRNWTTSQEIGWDAGLGSPGTMYYEHHAINCNCGASMESNTEADALLRWNTRST